MKILLFITCLLGFALDLSATGDQSRFIRGDLIWEYYAYCGFRTEVIRMKFDGKREIDGQVYSLLKVISDKDYYMYDDLGNGEGTIVDLLKEQPGRYNAIPMRESDGQLYRWIETEKAYQSNTGEEVLVLDMNVSVGDRIELPIGCHLNATDQGFSEHFNGIKRPLEVTDVSWVDVGSEKRKLITLTNTDWVYQPWPPYEEKEEDSSGDDTSEEHEILHDGEIHYRVMEGVGPICHAGSKEGKYTGTLAMLEYCFLVTGIYSGLTSFTFNRLFTADGTEVFPGAGEYIDYDNYFAGISPCLSEASQMKEKYFNLQGQRIAEPKPGDVVIRVCGDRREKIVMP